MVKVYLKRPIITEKTAKLAKNQNVYVFEVERGLNKKEIKKLIEEYYNVKVAKVRVVNLKERVRGLSKFKNIRPATKKAYVKLQPGYKINIFPE